MYIHFLPHSQLNGGTFYTISVQWKFLHRLKGSDSMPTNLVATS